VRDDFLSDPVFTFQAHRAGSVDNTIDGPDVQRIARGAAALASRT
jgi:hypothetical protein